MSQIARFGSFTADIAGCRVHREAEVITLQPRTFDLLLHLLHNPDTLLSRDDLLDALWPDVFVSDEALNQMVRRLRRALGDDARNPRYLATVPRRGYRFVAPVQWETDTIQRSVPMVSAPAPQVTEDSDAFFGRTSELADLHERMKTGARLVTLLGPGGAGKTRLAKRFAAEGEWPGGCWFVDLSEAVELEGLVRAVSGALKVPVSDEGAAAVEQLGRSFAALSQALVVLDNHEHVASLADQTLGVWLRSAPQAMFLVTSRVRLRLRNEEVLNLGALDTESARALFMERSRAAGARLDVERDGAAVDGLVADLDCAPLAIELAAGRSRVMSVAALRTHLDRRLQLLRSTDRDALKRHRSLRVVIEDSVEPLAAWERSALMQLSILPGRFSLETAEALLELPLEAPWTLDLLQDLCDQSVLQADTSGRGGFLMLESVRQYLSELGRPETLMPRARVVARARLKVLLAEDPDAPELDGLVALVMSQLTTCDDAEWLGEVALLTSRWLRERGPMASGLRLLDAALALSAAAGSVTPSLRVRLLLDRAHADRGDGDHWLSQAEPIVRENGLEELTVQLELARLLKREEAQRGQPLGAEGDALLARAEALGDVELQAKVLVLLAMNAEAQGQLDDAYRYSQRAHALRDQLGLASRAGVLDQLGGIHSSRTEYDEAIAHYRESCALYTKLGWLWRRASVLVNLSTTLSFSGRLAESVEAMEEARAQFRHCGSVIELAILELNLSLNYILADQLEDALTAIVSSRVTMASINHALGLATLSLNQSYIHWLRGELDLALEQCDTALALAEANALKALSGLLMSSRAGMLAQQGALDEAVSSLTGARAVSTSGAAVGLDVFTLQAATCMVELAQCAATGIAPGESLTQAIEDLRGTEEPFVQRVLLRLLDRSTTTTH